MKLIRKLRSQTGETLVESMASILIFTMASIILLSMIATASKINVTAKKVDAAVRTELYAAEAQEGDGETGSITVSYTVTGVGGTRTESAPPIPVSIYSSGENTLYSYSYSNNTP